MFILWKLLHCDEEVVFLAFLHQQIFTIDKVVGRYNVVKSRQFFLVHTYATAFNQLAHFAF